MKAKTLKSVFGVVLALATVFALACTTVGCAPTTVTNETSEPTTGELVLGVDDVNGNWTSESTPVIYHFVSENAGVDFTHAVTADTAGETLTMLPGDYTCSVSVPVNADGTTYDAIEDTTFTVAAGESVTGTTTLVAAESALDEAGVDEYLKNFDTLVELGDDSFTDELVNNVHTTLDAVKADLVAKAEAAAKAEAEAKAKAEAEAAAAAKSSTSSNYSNSGSTGNKSTANSGSSASKSSSGNTSSAPAQSAPAPSKNSGSNASSKPSNSNTHVHEWTTTTIDGEKFTECWCGATKGHNIM